jgi:hypothetical protein
MHVAVYVQADKAQAAEAERAAKEAEKAAREEERLAKEAAKAAEAAEKAKLKAEKDAEVCTSSSLRHSTPCHNMPHIMCWGVAALLRLYCMWMLTY